MQIFRENSCRRLMISTALAVILLCLPALSTASVEENSPLYVQAQRSADKDGYRLITTSGLKELLERNPEILLVDVRFSYEFASGHMPEAVSLPVDLRDRGDLPMERRQVMLDVLGPDKTRPIVLYCRDFR